MNIEKLVWGRPRKKISKERKLEVRTFVSSHIPIWLIEFPNLSEKDYLQDIVGLDPDEANEVFMVRTHWYWRQKRHEFTKRVEETIFERGLEERLSNFEQDYIAGTKLKSYLIDYLSKGEYVKAKEGNQESSYYKPLNVKELKRAS